MMGFFWRWWTRAQDVIHRRRRDEETIDEFSFHIDMETRALIAQGVAPAEARRQARLRFGGEERFREEVARTRYIWRLDEWWREVRHAVRGLRRSPGFTITAALTLAVGIGANTAIFSAVHSVLLRPLPYAEPDRVLQIQTSYSGGPGGISPAEFLDYREQTTDVFEALGVYSFGSLTLTGHGDPALVRSAFVSAETFDVLGVPPVFGRTFTAAEEENQEPLVLISEGFWRTVLGADPAVLDATLVLSGFESQIIGVLPDSLSLPDDLLSGQRAQIFAPQGIVPSQAVSRGSHYLDGIARVKAGVSVAAAKEALEAVGRRMVEQYSDAYPEGMRFSVTGEPVAQVVHGPIRTPILLLSGAVLFVLLIAAANVTNLMLARLDRRRHEFSLRSALGAGRGRLARQALVESLVLGLAGGAAGVGVSWVLLRAVTVRAAQDLPWLANVTVQLPVLIFGLLLALATALLLGVVPALQAGARNPNEALAGASRGSSSGRRVAKLRQGLIVGQIAVSLILLAAGGLMVDSLRALLRVDPGFETEQILTTRISLPNASYPDAESRVQFFEQLVQRFEQVSGVESVGAVTNLPLASGIGDLNFRIEGRPIPDGAVSPAADWQVVAPGYFETMGIDVVEGRVIDRSDVPDSPGVVVVNQQLAEQYWPGESPIGRRFLLGGEAGPGWVSIIGVVRDVRHTGLDQTTTPPQMYLAHPQFRFWGSGAAVSAMTVVLKYRGGEQGLPGRLRAALAEIDGQLPLSATRRMTEVRQASVATPRILALLTGAFAVAAMALAAIGMYGVISYSVGTRFREFGIRSALGASANTVLRQVLREGLALVATGIAVGVFGTWLTSGLLESVRFEGAGSPWFVTVCVVAFLAATALAAMLIPAFRATRISPLVVLRME